MLRRKKNNMKICAVFIPLFGTAGKMEII